MYNYQSYYLAYWNLIRHLQLKFKFPIIIASQIFDPYYLYYIPKLWLENPLGGGTIEFDWNANSRVSSKSIKALSRESCTSGDALVTASQPFENNKELTRLRINICNTIKIENT